MRVLLVFLCVLAFAPFGYAVQDSLAPDQPIELRKFDADRIASYQADPDYFYEREIMRAPSPWEQFKEWIYEWLRKLFGNEAGRFVTDNIYYLIILLGIGIAIYFLSKGGLRKVFYGEPRSLDEVAVVDEDIRGMDLQAMIAEAEQQGDLRRAIRLHYLLVLRKLVDDGVLHWGPEYTDRNYIEQIGNSGMRERFTHTARVFQWVWYGHAEIDQARYDSLRKWFLEFGSAPSA